MKAAETDVSDANKETQKVWKTAFIMGWNASYKL